MNRRPLFDAGPLLRQAVLAVDEVPVTGERVAAVLRTSERQVRRWQSGARLQEDTADRMATALGLHPVLLWPEWCEEPATAERGFMQWRGRAIQIRVYAGNGRRLYATARWRGSVEATEAAAEVLLERLLLELDDGGLCARQVPRVAEPDHGEERLQLLDVH